MKSPREILLNRHRSSSARLDAVRQNALDAAFPRADKRPALSAGTLPLRIAMVLWRELILPCRGIWTGLAALWAIILVLNLPGGQKPPQMARNTSPPDQIMLAVLREQREMLTEFLEPLPPSPADRRKTIAPRGELVQMIMLG
jgi:hypothetical protein